MQKDGRRKKAPGPPAFVNLVDRFLSGRDSGQKTKSPEHELATFAEREAFLRLGRKAGLPPREMQLLELFTSNPGISNPEAARELKIAVGTVKSLKHRIKRSLGAA